MTGRARGRPRQFDEGEVLDAAIGVFSRTGFSAATLDELSDATGLSRPSLYNAFGDKEGLYRRALGRFVEHLEGALTHAVLAEPDLATALRALYRGGLDLYFASRPPLGCFMFCTAPVEAIAHEDVRADVLATLELVDGLLEAKFAEAQANGQFPPDADPRAAAAVAQGVLHSIAIRARAGASRASLERLAEQAVRLICPD